MTDQRQKLADLSKDEREQLIKEAQDVGLSSTLIANWYVDTLRAKIEEKKQNQAADTDDAVAAEKPTDQTDAEAADQTADTDDEKEPDNTEAPSSTAEIDPAKEAAELDKDVEPPAPVKTAKTKQSTNNKTADADYKICHICRGKVINGKCTQCGFEISKR